MALILKEREVIELLTMAEGVRLVEESFKLYAQGSVMLAPRFLLKLGGDVGAFRVMAASMPELGGFGLKTLTGIPGKRKGGKTYFAMLLFDATSGALSCLLPATHLTGVRTGAASAVAAKYLARPDAQSVGLFGSGVQARAQIAALKVVLPIAKVKIHDIDRAPAECLGQDLADQGMEVSVSESARETVADTDVVVTATTSSQPVVLGEWLEEGMHVNAVGANSPAKRELDADAFRKSRLVLDYQDQVLAEAGDVLHALSSGALSVEKIHAELGDIVAGKKPGRESPKDITIFKSVGVAFEDVAVALWVYQEATKRGLGTELDLQELEDKPGLTATVGAPGATSGASDKLSGKHQQTHG